MVANRYICQKAISFPYAQYGKNIIFHNLCQASDQDVMDKVWKGYERCKTPLVISYKRTLKKKKKNLWPAPVFAESAS